jgi:hypothetical protein
VHASRGPQLVDGECREQRDEHHSQDDHRRLQAARPTLLLQRMLVGFVLAQQQRILLFLARRIELDLEGGEALIDLIAKLPLGRFFRQREMRVGIAPIAHIRQHRSQFVMRGAQLGERVGLAENRERLFEGCHAFGQPSQLM